MEGNIGNWEVVSRIFLVGTVYNHLAIYITIVSTFLDKYEHLDLFHRLTKIEEEFPGANVILHKVPNMPMVTAIFPFQFTRTLLFETTI